MMYSNIGSKMRTINLLLFFAITLMMGSVLAQQVPDWVECRVINNDNYFPMDIYSRGVKINSIPIDGGSVLVNYNKYFPIVIKYDYYGKKYETNPLGLGDYIVTFWGDKIQPEKQRPCYTPPGKTH